MITITITINSTVGITIHQNNGPLQSFVFSQEYLRSQRFPSAAIEDANNKQTNKQTNKT